VADPLLRRLTAHEDGDASWWNTEVERLEALRAKLANLASDLDASVALPRGRRKGSSDQQRLISYMASAYLGVTGEKAHVADDQGEDDEDEPAELQHFAEFVAFVAERALGWPNPPANLTIRRTLRDGRKADPVEYDEPLADDPSTSEEALGPAMRDLEGRSD
jgi:hypothetical protein